MHLKSLCTEMFTFKWLLFFNLCFNFTFSNDTDMPIDYYESINNIIRSTSKILTTNEKINKNSAITKTDDLTTESIQKKQYGNNSIKPHIIFILADDMGWNDISFHGSFQFMTPNIDALAYNGIQLHRLYAMHVCTPSRAALMTGYHPIHIGMQHRVLFGLEPRGLPLNLTLLPQYLNELGYESHIVGKWHLGFWKKEFTPLYRGFKSHVGFWTGHHHYFNHWATEWSVGGLDMRINMEPAKPLDGIYTTDIITARALEIINTHNKEKPLFLYISHAACHSADPKDPLPVPESTEKKFLNIAHKNRRKYAATTWKMDGSVGDVVDALQKNDMLRNSIIVFCSDNGGAAGGMNYNSASNWPLRGIKNTLWEGGVRVAGLIWSPFLNKQQRISHQYMHFTDWLPTLYYAAGGDVKNLGNIDGVNLWPALSNNLSSPRTEILHNIDESFKNAALTVDAWKIVTGSMYKGYYDKWFGPSGRSGNYNYTAVQNSTAAKALRSIGFDTNINQMKKIRKEASLNLPEIKNITNNCDLVKNKICLFNIIEDPCETENLVEKYPDIALILVEKLMDMRKTAVPESNRPLYQQGYPKYFNNVWTNFGDYK